jgi:ActR/RegA family two-component response regulator
MKFEPAVLIVDDDPSYLSLVTNAFRSHGISFRVELTGRGALHTAATQSFSAILLDLHLPDVDGLTVRECLLAQSPRANVILISGAGSISSAVQAIRMGAVDFLEKPIDVRELIDTITSASARHLPPAPCDRTSLAIAIAAMMLPVIQAPADVKTCDDWARLTGVSRAVLFARCERLRIRGKQALDLGRLLRVATHRPSRLEDLDGLLGSRDQRTIAGLLARSGLQVESLRMGPNEVLRLQQLLDAPELIEALRRRDS